MLGRKVIGGGAGDCKELMKDGYTKEAAEALCDVARSIGVKPSKLISAARKLEKEGIWLTAGDWLVVKEVMDKGFSLGTIVDYIIERRRAGLKTAEIIKELPLAAAHSAKRRHLLRNLMKALEALDYFSEGDREKAEHFSEADQEKAAPNQ